MAIERYNSLDGQVALVTGASRGIGEEVALQLSDRGAKVYAGARFVEDITHDELHPLSLDVSDEDSIRGAVTRLLANEDGLDILVNNAGVVGQKQPLHKVRIEDIDSVLNVNLRGPMILTKFVLPIMLEQESPRVVNVSSKMGVIDENTDVEYFPYQVSKAGLNMMTASIDNYDGLISNAVCPGWTSTSIGGEDAPRTPREAADTPVWLATFKPSSPSGTLWKDREPIGF